VAAGREQREQELIAEVVEHVEAAFDHLVAADHRVHSGALHELPELVAPEREPRVLALELDRDVIGVARVAPHHLEAHLGIVEAGQVVEARLEAVLARDPAMHEQRPLTDERGGMLSNSWR